MLRRTILLAGTAILLAGTASAATVKYQATLLPTASLSDSKARTFCRLRSWVEALLWERQPDSADVYRMKGVLHIAGSQTQRLLQVIGAAPG